MEAKSLIFISRPALLFLLTAGAGLVLTLHSLGRNLWCSCGSFNPFVWQASSEHGSQHLFDLYSPTHFLHGFLFYGGLFLVARKLPWQVRFSLAVLLEAAWEIAENSPVIIDRYRTATFALGYYGDSILNSLSDVLFCAGGFLFCSRYSWKVCAFIFVLIELLLLVLIRDNLTLNILMLVYPLPQIKAWQLG